MTEAAKDLDAGKAINEAAQMAAERAAELRKAFEERAEAAREWAVDQSDVLRDTVQTRPFIAVGVSAFSAFALGLALGVLIGSRR
jgi:ElaB/YqjD/DUF883 family membrane-anchored ribosome-binding protein